MTAAAQHQTYDPRDLEPVEGGSRFFRHRGPGGWGGDPATNAGLSLQKLLVEKREAAKRTRVKPDEETIYQVALVDGEYVVEPRGTMLVFRTLMNRRPGKVWKGQGGGAWLFDEFWLDGEAAEKANDREVWNGLRDALAANAPSTAGADLRMLNDLTAIALLLRTGVDAKVSELPAGPPAARRSR